MVASVRTAFERLLAAVVIVLLVALTAIVVVGVVYRKLGASLVWYDEVASVLLAWLTYYGAALAALKHAHIGFSGVIDALPARLRLLAVAIGEACVLGFFVLLAWVGWRVVEVLEGDTLVSLPGVSTQLTQSVIPVGAVLFVVAELLSLPLILRRPDADAPPAEGGIDP